MTLQIETPFSIKTVKSLISDKFYEPKHSNGIYRLRSNYVLKLQQINLKTNVRQLVVGFGFTTLLISQAISVAFYSEREKSDKFFLEHLMSAWGSLTCRKSATRDPRLYFPYEGSHTQDFYALKNPLTPAGFEPANLGFRVEKLRQEFKQCLLYRHLGFILISINPTNLNFCLYEK